MENGIRPKTPGLKYRPRKNGPDRPYWIASPAAVKAGYPLKSVSLGGLTDDLVIVARCQRLQAEMLMWLNGQRGNGTVFDGTFRSLLNIYQTDPESSYHRLKPASRYPYDVYCKKLVAHIGERSIAVVNGKDLQKWFAVWSDDNKKLAAARMAVCVIKAAIRFGIISRLPGCAAFREILDNITFPTPRPRVLFPTAQEIDRARAAAKQANRPLRALAYALQFETTLRQRDVIGEWVDMADPRPSSILSYGQKWLGPTWANIDDDLIMRVTPSKTETTTEKRVTFDLKECPMVMEELVLVLPEKRTGALIVDERTGLPYRYDVYRAAWRRDATAAGIAREVWNRDIRAGGVTEGDLAGASLPDRSRVAGHARTRITAQVYDRDTLEAHRRVALARKVHRTKGENK